MFRIQVHFIPLLVDNTVLKNQTAIIQIKIVFNLAMNGCSYSTIDHRLLILLRVFRRPSHAEATEAFIAKYRLGKLVESALYCIPPSSGER